MAEVAFKYIQNILKPTLAASLEKPPKCVATAQACT
jgi:hypothetical protein